MRNYYKERYIFIFIITVSAVILFSGLNWGLPSAELNDLYYLKTDSIEKIYTAVINSKSDILPRSFYNPIRSYHPDEYFIIKSLQALNFKKLLSFEQFSIGGAFLFLYAFFLLVLSKLHVVYLTRDILFYFFNPHEIAKLYIIGRFICVIYSIGILIITYVIAKKMWGSKLNAFLTFFLLLFSPLFILNSHYMYVDIPGVFWIMLTLYFSVNYVTGSKKNPLLIGLIAGIAAGNKLTFILVFLIPLISFLIVTEPLKNKIKNIILAFTSFVIILFLSSPYLFSALYQIFYGSGKNATSISFTPKFYILSLKYGLGLPLLLLSTSGIILQIFHKKQTFKPDKILILLWVITFFFIMSLLSLKYARYLLPIIPPLIIIGVGGWSLEIKNRIFKFFKYCFLTFVVLFTFFYGMAFELFFIKDNIRTEAGKWLKANILPGSSIGVTEIPWQFQMPPFDYQNYSIIVTGYEFKEIEKKTPDFFILSSLQVPISPYPVHLQKERKLFLENFIFSNLYEVKKEFKNLPQFLGIVFKLNVIPEDLIYMNPSIIIFEKKSNNKNEKNI